MISVALQTIRCIFNMALFKASAADLPFSWPVLGMIVALKFLKDFFSLSVLPGASTAEIVIAVFLHILLFATLVYGILRYRQFSVRFPKVLAGIFGVELLIVVLLNACLYIVPAPLHGILLMGYLAWNVTVKAKIFKDALAIQWFNAILILFGVYTISMLPTIIILGEYLQALTNKG